MSDWYDPATTNNFETIQFVVEPETPFVSDFSTITDTVEYRTGVEVIQVQFVDNSTAPDIGAVFFLDDGETTFDDDIQFIVKDY